jgi:hypothetical protein
MKKVINDTKKINAKLKEVSDETLIELFNLVRDRQKHEDELLNSRVNILLVFQGFLFSALISASTAEFGKIKASPLSESVFKIINSLPILGIVSSIITGISVLAAILSQFKNRKYLKETVIPEIQTRNLPYRQSDRYIHRMGILTPVGFVFLMIGIWIYIIL